MPVEEQHDTLALGLSCVEGEGEGRGAVRDALIGFESFVFPRANILLYGSEDVVFKDVGGVFVDMGSW